ncbi:hypothetical protein [Pseudarthrobacter sp. B4EP4b]|nr:hypothetical protein [Pseudarthrobacter sp. B4EP4b]
MLAILGGSLVACAIGLLALGKYRSAPVDGFAKVAAHDERQR